MIPFFLTLLFNPHLLLYLAEHGEADIHALQPEAVGINLWLFAVITGFAVVAASLFLGWGAEAGQFIFAQAFALAILAILQVLPEYMFEATLAWKRHIELASATMTGSNRLLLGLGWPLIVFIAYLSSKLKGENQPVKEVRLDVSQSVEIFFLTILTLYSFVIVAKRTLDIIDAIILVSIYVIYLIFCMRMPTESEEKVETLHGPAKIVLNWPPTKRNLFIALSLVAGAIVIFFGAPLFIGSTIGVALLIGVDVFLFAQWVGPFLSEFPESATAFYFATKKELAPMGIGNLVSSKVNQWSLLIGTIPIVYSLSVGHLAFIPLNELQQHEILLTAAQSLYGVAALMKLRFSIREAIILFILWFLQFIYPPIRIEVTIIYILLAIFEIIYFRHENKKMLIEFKKAVNYILYRSKII